MKNIAIFASGAGSNAENIVNFFASSSEINVALILCNNPSAGVLSVAKRLKVPSVVFSKKELVTQSGILQNLLAENIDFIVLAGFLWLIPPCIINHYPNRIINIHPALLPKYGGKGMYGMNVHYAVVLGKEVESGITIHYVNEKFDEGEILFQASFPIESGDTAQDVARKVHELEYEHFPPVLLRTICP